MLGLSIVCVIIVLVIVLFTEPRQRVPADGLDRLAPSRTVGGRAERPIRVRLDPPAEDRRSDPRGRPGAASLAFVVLLGGDDRRGAELPAGAGPRLAGAGGRDRAAGGRLHARSARRSGSCARASTGARTGRSRSPSRRPPATGTRKLTTVRVDANTGKVAAVNREE